MNNTNKTKSSTVYIENNPSNISTNNNHKSNTKNNSAYDQPHSSISSITKSIIKLTGTRAQRKWSNTGNEKM